MNHDETLGPAQPQRKTVAEVRQLIGEDLIVTEGVEPRPKRTLMERLRHALQDRGSSDRPSEDEG